MKILSVSQNSTGAELGLKPGDKIEAIDGSRVRDVIDYRFKVSDENIVLRVRQDGAIQEYDIEKDYDDNLGLEFEDFRIRNCANDCIFCFVDQNPPGMRDAMYFRDGDFRMSFLHGHYITMTNMGWNEMKRVVDQRLTPLYISVHVTQPDKRLEMFLYGKDDQLLRKFEYLAENGIELHSQVVLCPSWNDGKFLEQTIKDINAFSPMARSMSVVPAGLTKHRDGLPYIAPVTVEYAEEFVPIAEELAENVALPDIEILYLHTNKLKDIGLEELADSEFFEPLKELWLYENKIGDDGTVALAESDNVLQLRYLSLYTNKIGDAGAVALANSKSLKNLETLDLSFNRIGDEGAIALANSTCLKNLKALHLDANRIGFPGMQAFAKLSGLKSLETLKLTYNLVDTQGLELLDESKRLQSLNEFKTDIFKAND